MDEVFVEDAGETVGEFSVDGKKKKMIRVILFLLILVIIAGVIVALIFILKKDDDDDDKDRTKTLMTDNQFIKPKNTIKQYELIELDKSKYKFILVHDPHTFTAGIEIRTNSGFNTEFADGFAHYAEHIFFEGNEKVTELDLFNLVIQFDEFINAYTWEEETVFQYFNSDYKFTTLLDYISSIIQKQKFNHTFLRTEIGVVTSEFDGYNDTFENAHEIYRENANPDHSFSQTNTGKTGNKESLGIYEDKKLEEMLRNYYRIIFNPENCVFVLYSSKSFEDMRLLAQKYFDFVLEEPTQEYIELYNNKTEALDNPLFLENSLGKIAFSNFNRDTPVLLFLFTISQKSGKVDASEILNYLFNKKEDNSLLQYLYNKNYISNFQNGIFSYIYNNHIYAFIFDLTKDGYENIDKIIEAFFATVNTLKDNQNIQDLLNNIESIKNASFINREEASTVFPDDIDNLLRNYAMFGPKNLLGNPINLTYDENRVKEILNELTPDKSFIYIDSKDKLNSKYLTSDEILFTRNYKTPYKINRISDVLLTQLNNIKTVDDYTFNLRTKNEKYTKLNELTQKPCYENKEPYKCEYNEYDQSKDESYEPYVVRNENNIVSLMKIDRSYGIPFVKGYIELIFDENEFKEFFSNTSNQISGNLLLDSFNYIFLFSDLYEGGSSISISIDEFKEDPSNKVSITFSTYNDLLEDVINYIMDFFDTPIDESTFNSMKEYLYYYNSNENGTSIDNLMYDSYDLFIRLITADTIEKAIINKENIMLSSYSDFNETFFKITKMITSIKYLTHGDISYEQSSQTTTKLSNLINKELEVNLKLSAEKKIDIPENISIIFSYKIQNEDQRQGAVLVRYEFNESLYSYMYLYSKCTYSFFFDYIRAKRGAGYHVHIMPVYIKGKYYLQIFAMGKIYSPEKMDRFINEAIIESFSFKKCLVKDVINHIKRKDSEPPFYAEEKFQNLVKSMNPEKLMNSKLKKEELNFDSIVKVVKGVLIDKPKRISILLHRGDISDDDLKNQKAELDDTYFLNTKIRNEVTEDIKYLEKFLE